MRKIIILSVIFLSGCIDLVPNDFKLPHGFVVAEIDESCNRWLTHDDLQEGIIGQTIKGYYIENNFMLIERYVDCDVKNIKYHAINLKLVQSIGVNKLMYSKDKKWLFGPFNKTQFINFNSNNGLSNNIQFLPTE